MQKLLLYTPHVTERIKYTFQLFFDSLIRTPYLITTDEAAYVSYHGPKLNYSGKNFAIDKLHILPCGLLTEKDIRPQSIQVSEWKGLKAFFRTDIRAFSFDIFSAAFFLVSRYEEYLPHEPD